MKIYFCEQRSKQWYDLRCGKLTASNFHCMLGNSWTSHSYILEKAMERLTGKCVQHRFWTEDLQRGIDLESGGPQSPSFRCRRRKKLDRS